MATARVYVTLKKSVFDPQGKTIHDALRSLGYGSVADVRQGKYFEVVLDGMEGEDARKAADAKKQEEARKLAHGVVPTSRHEGPDGSRRLVSPDGRALAIATLTAGRLSLDRVL
jgi:phosphoribosylformylglycinamidine synthase